MSFIIQSGSYDIFIGNDTFLQLGKFLSKNQLNRKLFVLVDENTKVHCLPLISERVTSLKEATLLEMIPGEKYKSLSSCEKLWNELTEHHADRRSLLLNVGGGVVCDVGGFVASTFVRGIEFVNVPTTLLAMVDASTGGKNGINFSGLKNQVGTFTKPEAVFISPSFLKTLPERELKSGFSEVIKHTLIADPEKWNELKQMNTLTAADWIKVISHSVYIKNKIVNSDFRERNKRKTLNFGHTIGHALEGHSMLKDPEPMKHGEAIAFGMISELYLSMKMLDFPQQDVNEISEFIQNLFPGFSFEINSAELIKLIHSDKKNEQSEVNFSLLKKIGEPVINQKPNDALIREAIDFSFQRLTNHLHQA